MMLSAGLRVVLLTSTLLGMPSAARAVGPGDAQPGQAPAIQVPPLPPPRPADVVPALPPQPAEASESAATPLPPERPPELASPPAAAPPDDAPQQRANAPAPPERPPELSGPAAIKLSVAATDDTACLRRLERLGVRFEKAAPITNGQCSLGFPITVRALADGVMLEPGDTMTCPIAEALARWATEVQVAARQQLDDSLTGLRLGGAYHCRGQNHASDGKLSEHSFGNAVDIMGFTFEKHPPILIQPRQAGSIEAEFQRSVWTIACRFFRTVLGPGSNASHDNHLHFDERERTGGHRLCE